MSLSCNSTLRRCNFLLLDKSDHPVAATNEMSKVYANMAECNLRLVNYTAADQQPWHYHVTDVMSRHRFDVHVPGWNLVIYVGQ